MRRSVGLFDVSHMGDIRIHGGQLPGGALAAVQHITMNDASHLAIGQAQYSAMLYPEGTFVDDVIVHRLGEDDFLLVINAGTREKDINWVRDNTKSNDCWCSRSERLVHATRDSGPASDRRCPKTDRRKPGQLRNYWFMHGRVCGLENTLIARTGYTGEDGFEIYIPSDRDTSEEVWTTVMNAGREFGILACGLGARNTLRLEAKLSLYGHEISESINVWEAGLDRFCKMEKGDFIGRVALERAHSAACRARSSDSR